MSNPSRTAHALVSGGTRGLGYAIAGGLVEAGYRVTVLGRRAESAATAAAALGAAGHVHADVRDREALEAALAEAVNGHGPVEVLVNNAGSAETAPFRRTSVDQLRSMMALNVEPLLTAMQFVLPGMVEAGFGRIVTVASTAGLKGYAYASAYCASKHAAVGLTRAVALETAGTGVTVNAVCPGYADTDMIRQSIDALHEKTGRPKEELLGNFTRQNPMGRLIDPVEVAGTVVWLAGANASAITGQAVPVAGGEL
ncbi:SDR family NAD(P)-dependent oxidoreductase [Pararhizobium mangrovi]|uniref:SDR family NAD(P)-dependent oxidoreductase n=1 Tax=Pararhizobium mangrovi TaxID=2590452 RepID=UPI001F23A89A|nr:SDR family oxidoreductase [Pararhizobium mangrovi]